MTISILDRIRKGREAEGRERADAEVLKLGVLRAGMTGIMSDNGDIAGTCARKTLVRSLGIEIEKPDESKLIMFELGFASEDITAEILKRSLLPGEILLREEEIPVAWQTRNGTKVTGRPDIVVCRSQSGPDAGEWAGWYPINVKGLGTVGAAKPLLGLELKSVHSVWTMRDVLFGGRYENRTTGEITISAPGPKLGNVAQAAHYMWKLNVPYKLVYKGYSQLGQSMNNWTQGLINIPKQGEPLSQFVDYNPKDGAVKGFKQFEIAYDLQVDESGTVCYKLESSTDWIKTVVSTQDIERYYEFVSTMTETQTLGPRPMTIDAHGAKLNWKECAYCPMQKLCDEYESAGFETWLTNVKGKYK